VQYVAKTVSSLRQEQHDIEHIRLRHDDVEVIQQGTLCANIVGLFSTNNSKEPVFLSSLETLFVQLPNTEENEMLLSSTTEGTNEMHEEDTKTLDQKKNNL
jgi:hypothetical protein